MGDAKITLSPEFGLDLDVAVESIAILGTKGSGKSHTAAVFAEELWAANVQFVILDPTGVFWGLRSNAKGTGEGIPIVILGGPHGDAPLEPTAGALIADVLVDTGQSLVLDLSDFPSKAAQTRFATDLAERLYRRKARARSPLHIIIDESEEFIPQDVRGEGARMVGAWETIVALGRSRGLGETLISRRVQAINKKVLDLIETMLALRTSAPLARKRIEEWIEEKEVEDDQGVVSTLKALPTGTAWVWAPTRGELAEVKVRRLRTFDSYATPKPGQIQREARALAPINVAALGAQIAATVEQSKANDPAELRKRIRELERAASDSSAANEVAKTEEWFRENGWLAPGEQPPPEKVEVPIATIKDLDGIWKLIQAAKETGASLQDVTRALVDGLQEVAQPLAQAILDATEAANKSEREPVPSRPSSGRRQTGAVGAVPSQPARVGAATSPAPRSDLNGTVTLGRGERRVLEALAEYPEGRTQNELAFLAGYSAKASTISSILSELRKRELVERGQPIRPTAEGLDAVGGARERPRGPALLQTWLQHPRMGGGEQKVLRALVDADGVEPTFLELCEATGYSPDASTISAILSNLRKLGLVEKRGRKLSPEFAEAIAA